MNKFYIVAAGVSVLLVSQFFGATVLNPSKETIAFDSYYPLATLYIDGVPFSVGVAETYEERRNGLSFIESLPKDSGLLFVFTISDSYGIWMKTMLFPIDIIWFDENFRVIDITKNISPDSYPDTFYPKSPVRYILEVEAGFVKANSVKIGSTAKFESK